MTSLTSRDALTDVEGEGVGAEGVVQHGDAEREDGRGAEAVDGLCQDEDAEVARDRPGAALLGLGPDGRTPRLVVAAVATHVVHLRRRLGPVDRRREVGQAEEETAAHQTDEAEADGPGPVDPVGET